MKPFNPRTFSLQDIIKKRVNREAELWYPPVKVELPKFEKPPKVAYPQWVKNLLKGSLGQLLP